MTSLVVQSILDDTKAPGNSARSVKCRASDGKILQMLLIVETELNLLQTHPPSLSVVGFISRLSQC